MSTIGFLILCFQACLIQSVMSHCGCGFGKAPFGHSKTHGWSKGASCGSAYGGMGSGDVAVTGEMDVSGLTTVEGSVPVLGGLTFGGLVPASGVVTITGSCACPQPAAPCAPPAAAALAGAELAGFSAGLAGAEWAAANAGLAAAEWAAINAAARGHAPAPACGVYY